MDVPVDDIKKKSLEINKNGKIHNFTCMGNLNCLLATQLGRKCKHLMCGSDTLKEILVMAFKGREVVRVTSGEEYVLGRQGPWQLCSSRAWDILWGRKNRKGDQEGATSEAQCVTEGKEGELFAKVQWCGVGNCAFSAEKLNEKSTGNYDQLL